MYIYTKIMSAQLEHAPTVMYSDTHITQCWYIVYQVKSCCIVKCCRT